MKVHRFQNKYRPESQAETAFKAAFLSALILWAKRETRSGPITLPSGSVDANELRKVVIALLSARNGEACQ